VVQEQVSARLKAAAWLAVAVLSAAAFFACAFLSSRKSSSWQVVYVATFLIQLCVDAVLVQSAVCVTVHAWIPSLFAGDIARAHRTLAGIAAKLCNKAWQPQWRTRGCSVLDAPRYFFASHRLSRHFPRLLESALVQSYHANCLDDAAAEAAPWQEVAVQREAAAGGGALALCGGWRASGRRWAATALRGLGCTPAVYAELGAQTLLGLGALGLLLCGDRGAAQGVLGVVGCVICSGMLALYVGFHHKGKWRRVCGRNKVVDEVSVDFSAYGGPSSSSSERARESGSGSGSSEGGKRGARKRVPEAYRDLVKTYPFLQEEEEETRAAAATAATGGGRDEALPLRSSALLGASRPPFRCAELEEGGEGEEGGTAGMHLIAEGGKESIVDDIIAPTFTFRDFRAQVEGEVEGAGVGREARRGVWTSLRRGGPPGGGAGLHQALPTPLAPGMSRRQQHQHQQQVKRPATTTTTAATENVELEMRRGGDGLQSCTRPPLRSHSARGDGRREGGRRGGGRELSGSGGARASSSSRARRHPDPSFDFDFDRELDELLEKHADTIKNLCLS
jgi:hypothetical protein